MSRATDVITFKVDLSGEDEGEAEKIADLLGSLPNVTDTEVSEVI